MFLCFYLKNIFFYIYGLNNMHFTPDNLLLTTGGHQFTRQCKQLQYLLCNMQRASYTMQKNEFANSLGQVANLTYCILVSTPDSQGSAGYDHLCDA